jgi:hypothetical protein
VPGPCILKQPALTTSEGKTWKKKSIVGSQELLPRFHISFCNRKWLDCILSNCQLPMQGLSSWHEIMHSSQEQPPTTFQDAKNGLDFEELC